jgi:hypothetical protein
MRLYKNTVSDHQNNHSGDLRFISASLLQTARALRSFGAPSEDDWNRIKRFIDKREPLLEAEQSFIYHKDDLIALQSDQEIFWLDVVVRQFFQWLLLLQPLKELIIVRDSPVYTSKGRG